MFNQARIKLTAWYLLIIMLISISFSLVIYKGLMREVERFAYVQRFRIERRLYEEGRPRPLPNFDADLVKETRQRIILLLVLINAGIFVISGGFGYLLAGATLKPIKEMLDEQNRFISDASHELRTPLTSLKTSMEVSLRDKNLALDNAKTLIAESIKEVDKLQSLSDELLQMAQYQKPGEILKFEKVLLKEIVNQALAKVGPILKQKQIEVINKTENYKIKGDTTSLVSLLVILFDNAAKFSPAKSTITLTSKKINGSVSLSVKDQGIGIAEKDLPHIFDRFYRADTSRSKIMADGYGLGLSIAKKIVAAHNGSISVKSKLKKGSIFTITLPIFRL